MNQEFWQEGEGWLKYPLPRSGRCSTLGADYPPPGKTPPQGLILRGKLRPKGGFSGGNSAPRGCSPGETPPQGAISRGEPPPPWGGRLENWGKFLGGGIIRPPP